MAADKYFRAWDWSGREEGAGRVPEISRREKIVTSWSERGGDGNIYIRFTDSGEMWYWMAQKECRRARGEMG
jgi:hypothetical protein